MTDETRRRRNPERRTALLAELRAERFPELDEPEVCCRPCNGFGGIWIGQPDSDPPLVLVSCADCNGTGVAT